MMIVLEAYSQDCQLGLKGVACAGFRAADEDYMGRLKLSLCVLIGVLLTVVVALAVFPIRARTLLRKRTAAVLERMGNLAFYLMGEFCEVRPPPVTLLLHACNRHSSVQQASTSSLAGPGRRRDA